MLLAFLLASFLLQDSSSVGRAAATAVAPQQRTVAIDDAFAEVQSILNAERLKRERTSELQKLDSLRDQAKAWTTTELVAALDGLVELDAMVKGMPGEERADAQRRLAFSLWVIDHVGGRRRQTA